MLLPTVTISQYNLKTSLYFV